MPIGRSIPTYSRGNKLSQNNTDDLLKPRWSNWLRGRTRRLPRAFSKPRYNQALVNEVRNKKATNTAKLRLRNNRLPKSALRQKSTNSVTPMLKWRNNETNQPLENVQNISALRGFNETRIRMHGRPSGTLRNYGPRFGSNANKLRDPTVVPTVRNMSNNTRRRLNNALRLANASSPSTVQSNPSVIMNPVYGKATSPMSATYQVNPLATLRASQG
jgi:hypothetical protein